MCFCEGEVHAVKHILCVCVQTVTFAKKKKSVMKVTANHEEQM